MKIFQTVKITIIAVIGALLCAGCVVHRDHPKPPRHKKHHKKPKPRHHRPPHPHASIYTAPTGATYYLS